MKRYKARIEMVSYLYLDIDAEDIDEAYDICENTDGGCFTEYDCSWEIMAIDEVK